MEDVSPWLKCLNTWSPVEGAVWDYYRTFRRERLDRGSTSWSGGF